MELKYHTIDMTGHHSNEEVALINKSFLIWYEAFQADLQSRGVNLNKAEFHRARILAILEFNGQVAGFHLYSVFDLRELPSLSHPYLSGLPEETKTILSNRGSRSLMAMEYLTVTPEFRSVEVFPGVKVAELLVRLGLKVMEALNLDAAIGVARIDRKVNSLADSIGCEEVSLLEKYNNKCSLMYFDRRIHKAIGSLHVLRLVDEIWNFRKFDQVLTKKAS